MENFESRIRSLESDKGELLGHYIGSTNFSATLNGTDNSSVPIASRAKRQITLISTNAETGPLVLIWIDCPEKSLEPKLHEYSSTNNNWENDKMISLNERTE